MYQNGIGISDIASNIGISRAYLNSAFQKELNMSAQSFLIDYRMHKAASLLLGTDMSVKEIARCIGYTDQLVFSKAFKKKFKNNVVVQLPQPETVKPDAAIQFPLPPRVNYYDTTNK